MKETIILLTEQLGDTLAWVPVVEEYRKQTQHEIRLITRHNNLFNYPQIEFIDYIQVVKEHFSIHVPTLKSPSFNDIGIQHQIGLFVEMNPLTRPLQQIAADILEIEFEETRPRLNFVPQEPTIDGDYICIAPHSTLQLKFWNHEGGWQSVVDYYNSRGYKVVHCSHEPPTLNSVIDCSGQELTSTMNTLHHSKAVIGLSSGVSWLAWALHKPVILISGFTPKTLEFKCERIINKTGCGDCWSRTPIDTSDFMWCPDHKNTERMFECSKLITPSMVIESTNRALMQA